MSIHGGTFSLSRYRVLGRRRSLNFSDLGANFKNRQLKPFRMHSSAKELVFGWDFPHEIYEEVDRPKVWDIADCRFDEGIWLKVRIEKRAVPKQLLSLMFQQKLQQETQRRQGKAPGRNWRKSHLDALKEELLQQSLPSISFFEAYWRDGRDEISLFTGNKTHHGMFLDLFQESFGKPLGLSLVPYRAPLMGFNKAEWHADLIDENQILSEIDRLLPAEEEMAYH